MNEQRITFEGFIDYSGDFDMGVYICKPFVNAHDALSLDSVIEDVCIDLSLGDPIEDDDFLDRRHVLNTFYRVRKKSTRTMRYWKRTVEIYPLDDSRGVYTVLESVGE